MTLAASPSRYAIKKPRNEFYIIGMLRTSPQRAPKHHGPKGNPRVTPETYAAVGDGSCEPPEWSPFRGITLVKLLVLNFRT